jgi:tRNA1(Val) A37 N6-methylase TrmN6
MPSEDVNSDAAETHRPAQSLDAQSLDAQSLDAASPDVAAGTTLDLALGGRVRLYQPQRGYRAGLDAALLAAAVELGPHETALEAGCGPGAALLQVAWRTQSADLTGPCLTGVERDAESAALAQRNIAMNGQAARVRVIVGDVATPFSKLEPSPARAASFDAAFANPPFFDDPASLRGPAPARRDAYIADGGLKAWTAFLLQAVRQGGRITLVHRADRLADILALLSDGAGSFRIRPVQPFADQSAKRVLVRAVKGGKAPLALLPPLVLHARDGPKHTPQAEAILRGEAALPW